MKAATSDFLLIKIPTSFKDGVCETAVNAFDCKDRGHKFNAHRYTYSESNSQVQISNHGGFVMDVYQN